MMESMSLQQYICNLDFHSLPRVVKICSGVYFQGSVYEISGSECCLPTGELIKIVDIQLQKVNCESIKKDHLVELPLNFKGLFQLSPERPHRTKTKHFLLGSLTLKDKPSACDKQQYTLQEILESSAMRGKTLKCPEIGSSKYQLCPVYKVEAIMHLRNDVVKIDSTLDIEVVDVTDESQHIHFIKPLMLSEVLLMDNVLPVRAEILGAPENTPIFQSKWVFRLRRGCKIQIHSKGLSWKILASSRKGRRRSCHFLISSSYEGRFRRCPREFHSSSELASGLGLAKKLHVVVTKDYDGDDTELPLFGIGDRLEVLSLARAANPSAPDMLKCIRDNGDGDTECIKVPLFLDAGFVEDVRDSRKYTLSEVVERFHLPCEVKVVANKDTPDPLSCASVLTLEAQITEPFLTVSLEEEPSVIFEIPPRWLDVSLFLTGGLAKAMPPSSSPKVEELTEAFYYSLRKMLPNNTPAPPRPPKQSDSVKHKSSQRPFEEGRRASEPAKLPPRDSKDTFQETAKLQYPRTLQARADSDTLVNPNQYDIEYGPPRPQKTIKPFKQAIDACSDDHDYEEICE
ncbi:protein THEMIS2 [Heteronotia binoei]|uniref:protein THEMIS2 n=1 Tax=Heteronotia binoei TaxID=13085 RepID=UPI0029303525|nr:protein THEMIS2 [Heteronotia binoei]